MALSTAKLGIIGASTDRLARHIAQEGASIYHLLIRSNGTFRGTHVFPDPAPPTLSTKCVTAWVTQVGKCAVKWFIPPESWIQACFHLQDVTASRIVNVRMCLSSKWCSDPDMGQFISSSKLFKYSFNFFLEDSFCFPLRLLRLGSSVGGEDNSRTTSVELTSGSGLGNERSPPLPSALEFVSFTSSFGSPADGQQ
jgi:hypothetical protein